MIMSSQETEWVKDRMKIYDIKYQEIYDELLDHILTAIEGDRISGNTRNIEQLFQHVVDEHFGGFSGIEALAVSQEKLHRKSMRDAFFKRLKGQFNWPALVVTVILVVIAFNIPDVRSVRKVFALAVFLLAGSPVIYAYVLISGKIKTIKGKTSLLKSHLITQVAAPLMLLQAFLYIPNLIDEANGRKDFATVNNLNPPVMMAFLMLLIIVNLSYIQTCRDVVAKKLG